MKCKRCNRKIPEEFLETNVEKRGRYKCEIFVKGYECPHCGVIKYEF